MVIPDLARLNWFLGSAWEPNREALPRLEIVEAEPLVGIPRLCLGTSDYHFDSCFLASL